MNYEVSAKVKDLVAQLAALPEVQDALKFIEEDQDQTLNNQIDIVKVEAPTFHEQKRAEHYKKYYEDLGLENVHIDEFGNTVGIRRGAGSGPKVLMEGHLDTVFPFGSVVGEPEIKDGNVYAPGISDDTRGLVVCLSSIRALNKFNIKTKGDIVFAGTVEEEGMGGLGGIKKFLSVNKDIDACLDVDGFSAEGIVYQATGMRTCEANFYGIGGHAYGAFGEVANPLHAAARAVAKIADFVVPDDPKTTFCVSNFHAGNDAGIHAIVPKATIKYNIRSNSMEELDKLTEKILKAFQEACDEETAKWGKDTITFDVKTYVDVAAGVQDEHTPIVEALHEVISYLGIEPVWFKGGCTNANVPIGLGIPAVCIGLGTEDTKVHTLDEYFPIEGAYKGVQQAFLMALLIAGVEGKTKSLFEI